jgi:uncharacterized protein YxjI
MRYQTKQKWFSLGEDFAIRDETGQPVYQVDGRAFSLGNRLSFQDMQGQELAFIAQKLLTWGPTYEITRRGELVAVVKKSLFTFLRCEFTVDVPGPGDLVAEGNLWDREYTFSRQGQSVARVSKGFFSLADTYGIEIEPGEDGILILCAVVVIDLCCHEDRH